MQSVNEDFSFDRFLSRRAQDNAVMRQIENGLCMSARTFGADWAQGEAG
jgi:hypothetical protein